LRYTDVVSVNAIRGFGQKATIDKRTIESTLARNRRLAFQRYHAGIIKNLGHLRRSSIHMSDLARINWHQFAPDLAYFGIVLAGKGLRSIVKLLDRRDSVIKYRSRV
jgi:hypothetical protein